jgi:hypothetical protein
MKQEGVLEENSMDSGTVRGVEFFRDDTVCRDGTPRGAAEPMKAGHDSSSGRPDTRHPLAGEVLERSNRAAC